MILLYIAEVLVRGLWLHRTDPDDAAIPYLTAMGDLIGTALLALAFIFLFLLGYPVDSGLDETGPDPGGQLSQQLLQQTLTTSS